LECHLPRDLTLEAVDGFWCVLLLINPRVPAAVAEQVVTSPTEKARLGVVYESVDVGGAAQLGRNVDPHRADRFSSDCPKQET
jgi:hypothetical protein